MFQMTKKGNKEKKRKERRKKKKPKRDDGNRNSLDRKAMKRNREKMRQINRSLHITSSFHGECECKVKFVDTGDM